MNLAVCEEDKSLSDVYVKLAEAEAKIHAGETSDAQQSLRLLKALHNL